MPRWRGESSPRQSALGRDESGERIKLIDGWSASRFAAPGWPGNDAYVYLVDGRARIVSAWLIAAVLALGWALGRRRLAQARWRSFGLIGFLIASLLLNWLLPSRYASYAGGLVAGGLLILIAELSMETGKLRASRQRTESSLLRRGARAAVATGAPGAIAGASGERSGACPARARIVDPGALPVRGPI